MKAPVTNCDSCEAYYVNYFWADLSEQVVDHLVQTYYTVCMWLMHKLMKNHASTQV